MAQSIEDQINTIERALGERMVDHALVIVRTWLNELGENNPYEEAYGSINKRYKALFDAWLSSDDEETDAVLDGLTGETYQLVDAVYADIRVKRGMSPDMHGFNPENLNSVFHYFGDCRHIRREDYDWLRGMISGDSDHRAVALIALGSLAKNLRDCFSVEAFLVLIDGMLSDSSLLSEQCLAYVLTLLIHYDIRLDFFPQVQNAFIDALRERDEDGGQAFEVLCALVHTSYTQWSEEERKNSNDTIRANMPDELKQLLAMSGVMENAEIVTWMPKSEREYMVGLMQIFPDTWLYTILVQDNTERELQLAVIYLSAGRMDLLWEHTDVAEKYLVKNLRSGSDSPADYINLGHCLLLKGDRMMAFEYYKQARQLCKSAKAFYQLFRPDRRALVDHGIPVEQIYLIEDRLINV